MSAVLRVRGRFEAAEEGVRVRQALASAAGLRARDRTGFLKVAVPEAVRALATLKRISASVERTTVECKQ